MTKKETANLVATHRALESARRAHAAKFAARKLRESSVRIAPEFQTESPDYPISDWRYDVTNGDTRLGYWEWVSHNLEAHQDY